MVEREDWQKGGDGMKLGLLGELLEHGMNMSMHVILEPFPL